MTPDANDKLRRLRLTLMLREAEYRKTAGYSGWANGCAVGVIEIDRLLAEKESPAEPAPPRRETPTEEMVRLGILGGWEARP